MKTTKKSVCLSAAMYFIALPMLAQGYFNVWKEGSCTRYSTDEVDSIVFKMAENQGEINANGYEYVDMGLPSGTLWATCNVGASTPEQFGDYFAWGEVEGFNSGKTDFSWATYKWCYGSEDKLNKYCYNKNFGLVDDLRELELEDDAAHVYMGGDWRMPTYEQVEEIMTDDNCMKSFVTQNGVEGILLTSRYNRKSIFVPSAGWYDGKKHNTSGGRFYWSSSLYVYSPDKPTAADFVCCALTLDFYSTARGATYDKRLRYEGFPIRPVITPKEQ